MLTTKDVIRAYLKKNKSNNTAANDNNRIQVYLKSSCRPNPGKGYWASISDNGLSEVTFSGSVERSTNHRIELTAAVETLKRFKNGERITLYTSLKLLPDAMNRYIHEWKANDWLNSDNKKPQNLDLWLNLYNQYRRLRVKWVYISSSKLDQKHPMLAFLLDVQFDHSKHAA